MIEGADEVASRKRPERKAHLEQDGPRGKTNGDEEDEKDPQKDTARPIVPEWSYHVDIYDAPHSAKDLSWAEDKQQIMEFFWLWRLPRAVLIHGNVTVRWRTCGGQTASDRTSSCGGRLVSGRLVRMQYCHKPLNGMIWDYAQTISVGPLGASTWR